MTTGLPRGPHHARGRALVSSLVAWSRALAARLIIARSARRSAALARLAAASAIALAACADSPRGLLSSSPDAPPDVQQACALANTRCAHCHPIERVVVARGIGIHRWQMFVDEMRLKPSSGISLDEATVIFRCLRFVEEACVDCKQGRS